MNREIKFRAWDKEKKEMLLMSVSANYQPHFLQDLKSFGGGFRELFDPDLELMQFTGLKDKNSKEIYEEDINMDDDNKKSEIVFYAGGFYLKYSSTNYKSLGTTREFERLVIGNIYENPELLKNG